jgi:hypothetical protein
MSHIFINENGYQVCKHCGIAESTHYWNKDQTSEIMKRFTPIKTAKYNKTGKYHKSEAEWNRLLQLNSRLTTDISHFLYKEIIILLNMLPLSSEIKKNIHNYLIKKNLKSYRELIDAFYRLICIHDLPLTSVEFLEILQIGREYKFKPLTKLSNMESTRKYYWYITKQIEKAKKILNFSNEDTQRIYKIVLNYYNLIRFKMLKSSNPIYLIQNLVYYTIREKLQPNQHNFSKRNFEVQNSSFMTSIIKFLQEIKNLKLDSNFSEKLKISKRNAKLKATL